MVSAGRHHHVDEPVLDLPAAPDLGHGLELPVLGEGEDRLDLEHGPGHRRDLTDATPLLEILQGIHREEGEGILDELGHPLPGQLPPGGPAPQVLRQLEHGHPHPQGTADRVVDPYLQILPLLPQQPHHVVGPGQAAGEHHGDDPVVPLRRQLVKDGGDVLPDRQRGLGQLTGAEPPVDVGGGDVHAVPVLPVRAADPQRDHVDPVLLRQLWGQVRAGVGEQCDLSGRHPATSPYLTGPPPRPIIVT